MASWREIALTITTTIGALRTAQYLSTIPSDVKKAKNSTEIANLGMGAIGGILGTALGVDFLRRLRAERLNDSTTRKKRVRGVKLGHN